MTTPKPGQITTVASVSGHPEAGTTIRQHTELQGTTKSAQFVSTMPPVIPTLTGKPVTPIMATTSQEAPLTPRPSHTECSTAIEVISLQPETSKGKLPTGNLLVYLIEGKP